MAKDETVCSTFMTGKIKHISPVKRPYTELIVLWSSGENVDLQAIKYAAYFSTLRLSDLVAMHPKLLVGRKLLFGSYSVLAW